MKAACFSVAAMDYFPQQNAFFAGGNALNQAIRLADAGVSSTFLGALGNDEHGSKILNLLRERGVDVSQLEVLQGQTANNRLINDEYGERFGEEGAWQGGVFETYHLSEHHWDYIKGFELWITHASCPDFKESIKRKSTGNFLCVDYLHLPDINLLADTLNKVDIAFAGGDSSMITDIQKLSKSSKTLIVLTLGCEGSVAFMQGEKTHIKANVSQKVIDTTGCGDAFQSAFAYSYYQNRDIEKALKAGTVLGTTATQSFGGVTWST